MNYEQGEKIDLRLDNNSVFHHFLRINVLDGPRWSTYCLSDALKNDVLFPPRKMFLFSGLVAHL